MGVSPRKMWAVGLGLAGLIYLVAPTQGQAPKSDPRVQGTANPAGGRPATAGAMKPANPTVVGTIDLEYVFKNYDKVKAVMRELDGVIKVRKGELMKYDDQAKSVVEMMKKLNPSSDDYRKHENQLTELRAKMEASKEQAEREITLRNAETMATLYKEVQAYANWVAKQRGITHVLSASSTPPAGSDPNTVMAAISRPIVSYDPANDITNDVVYNLNRKYQEMVGGNAAARPAASQPAGKASAGGQ